MIIEAYCDESRQQYFGAGKDAPRNSYVLLGSIWINAADRSGLKEGIHALRVKHDVLGEFKWNRVSPSRLAFYTDLVDYFFASPARFRCIVLPASQLDAVQFHEGDNELMFYKFYYQLLHHWILDGNAYRFFLDMKTNRVRGRLKELERVLRNANMLATVEQVQALPSHQLDLLQLADVLMGAVGYHFHQGTTSTAKVSVVRRIEAHLRRGIGPTPRDDKKFNVFRWRPGGGW